MAMDGSDSSLVHGHGYWRLGSETVATGAGENRVVPAVVWLSQAGHSGSVGLSYGRQRLCGGRATESSSVRERSCRALAGAGWGSGGGDGRGDSGFRYGREKMK